MFDMVILAPWYLAYFGYWYDCCVSDKLFIAQCTLYIMFIPVDMHVFVTHAYDAKTSGF